MQKVDELAAVAMTVHHQQGDHDKALKAAGLIRYAYLRRVQHNVGTNFCLGSAGELCVIITLAVLSHPNWQCGMARVSCMCNLHLDCRSLSKREEKLRSYGYWKEVADMMQVHIRPPLHCKCKASTILLHTVLLFHTCFVPSIGLQHIRCTSINAHLP